MSLLLSPKNEERAKEAVRRAKHDPVAFSKAFCGIDMGPKQAELLTLPGRVQIAIAGRRFGKSLTTLIKALHACVTKPNQKWYVAAPSIDQATLYWKQLEEFISTNPLLERLVVQKSLKYNPYPIVEFKSGSVMEARSTTLDGKYLRGKGADGVIVTEAAFVRDTVWNEVIRALILDRKGRALIETTPNGAGNWTYQLYQLGMDDPDGYYRSFHATCYDNPRLDELEIERIKRELPDVAFRQEYLAEFVDDDSNVFPWSTLSQVIDDYEMVRRPLDNHHYVIGLDLAKHQDYTVICVLDITKKPYQIAEWHRIQGMRYTDIALKVNDISSRYDARVYLDATGIGDAVAEQVKECEPIVFTPRVREDLIAKLVVAVEGKNILLPASITELRDEMRYFRRIQHGQNIKAEAPSGMHDDTVFALGLAVHGAEGGGFGGLFAYYRQARERSKVIPFPQGGVIHRG